MPTRKPRTSKSWSRWAMVEPSPLVLQYEWLAAANADPATPVNAPSAPSQNWDWLSDRLPTNLNQVILVFHLTYIDLDWDLLSAVLRRIASPTAAAIRCLATSCTSDNFNASVCPRLVRWAEAVSRFSKPSWSLRLISKPFFSKILTRNPYEKPQEK